MTSLALALRPTAAAMARSQISRALALLRSPKCVLWQDASDLSTLFQDSAGTTPVTTVEQPVGRILDKSGNGRHFIQATPASRPTLSSRYNLLTKTEQFDDAVWTKQNLTPTKTGSYWTLTASAGRAGMWFTTQVRPASTAVHRFARLKAGTHRYVMLWSGLTQVGSQLEADYTYSTGQVFDLQTGNFMSTPDADVYAVSAGDGWWDLYRVTPSSSSDNQYYRGFSLALCTSTGLNVVSSGATVLLSATHTVLSTDASLPYQRVNTSSDYDFDFAKFPPYLRYDGVDDSQASAATVDLTGTDKITVVGAWHKAVAGTTVTLELSPNVDSNLNAFNLATDVGAVNWYLSSGGNAQGQLRAYLTPAVSPVSHVLSAVIDRSIASSSQITSRLNGVVPSTTYAGTASTGNFGNYTMFVGSRNGSSLRFNGREYGFALFNTTLSASELAAVEAYFRSKSRAY